MSEVCKLMAYMFIAMLFFVGVFWTLYHPDSECTESEVVGLLQQVWEDQGSVEIVVDDNTYVSFELGSGRDKLVEYLKQNIGEEVWFIERYYKDNGNTCWFGLDEVWIVHEWTAAVSEVWYDEEGWFYHPPMRVIFDDGRVLTFQDGSDFKFEMYAQFVVYVDQEVTVQFRENHIGKVRVMQVIPVDMEVDV